MKLFCIMQGTTLAEEEEDPLLYKHRHLRHKPSEALNEQGAEMVTIKKLHVSSANLQRVGPVLLCMLDVVCLKVAGREQ